MEATGTHPMPSCAICLSPKMTARIATSDRAALVRSRRPASGCAVLRQQPRPQHEQQRHDGQGHQEDRAPPEVLEEHAPEHRADRASRREAHDPHSDRDRALPRVEEHVEDQRERRRCQRRARDALQRAARDQHLGARRERGEHRDGGERRSADHQQPATTDAVAERPHRDEEAGDHEPVDVDDPEQLRTARLEVRAERRHREVQHRQVHRVEQAREREHAEPDPLAPCCLWWGLGLRLHLERHPPTSEPSSRR